MKTKEQIEKEINNLLSQIRERNRYTTITNDIIYSLVDQVSILRWVLEDDYENIVLSDEGKQ